ncbi:MAG: lipid II flippase MurJ, partial [Verrucomicrobiota bacterium]
LWAFVLGIVSGALPDALVPVYAKRSRKSLHGADQLAVHAAWIYLGQILISVGLALLAAPALMPIYAAGFSPEKQDLALQYFQLLAPFALFFGASSLITVLLQAKKRFFLSSASQAIIPITIVVCMVTLSPLMGMKGMIVGAVAGSVLHFLLIGTQYLRNHCSADLRPSGSGFQVPEIKLVLRTMSPYLLSGILMGATSLVDFGMAGWLDEGSVSVLGYGLKLTAIFLTLAITATSEAFFPFLSDLVADEDWERLRATTIRFSALIFAISLPLVAALWFFAEPIVRIVLEHGQFSAEDRTRVAELLGWLGLQIPFQLLAVFASRIVTALLASRFMLATTVVNLVTNVIANFLLVQAYGIHGIALATALVYLLSTLMLYAYIFGRTSRLIRSNAESTSTP